MATTPCMQPTRTPQMVLPGKVSSAAPRVPTEQFQTPQSRITADLVDSRPGTQAPDSTGRLRLLWDRQRGQRGALPAAAAPPGLREPAEDVAWCQCKDILPASYARREASILGADSAHSDLLSTMALATGSDMLIGGLYGQHWATDRPAKPCTRRERPTRAASRSDRPSSRAWSQRPMSLRVARRSCHVIRRAVRTPAVTHP